MKIHACLITLFSILLKVFLYSQSDVTIIGYGIYTEALGRLSITTLDMLKDDLKVNYIPTDNVLYPNFISSELWDIMNQPDKSYGNVSLIYQLDHNILVNCNSKIKILYTMFDSSAILENSAAWYNEKFDLVVVPDEWLVDVYKKGGVTIPIFVLPCPIYLDEFLSQPPKYHNPAKFIFGSSGAFVPRKNHIGVLEAFIQEFGNNPLAKLKLHGRWGTEDQILRDRINQSGVTNVEIINQTISQQEFVNFMTSLDCYVFLSKGEGYSITPREALSCGIPCILTNNTAHKTLCNSGFVISVTSEILEPSYYCADCGYFYNCTVEDVRKAMREVYDNYHKHLKIAAKARNWVKKYDRKFLNPFYLSLIKPQKVVLGNENKVEDNCLITDSPVLYEKYQNL